MMLVPELPQNPFRNPEAKPDWAKLTRLAGDRAAILFEELRRRLGRIEGIQEDLHYYGPDIGWAPRYRVRGDALFTAHILPGRLETTIGLESPLREKLLGSSRVASRIKDAIRSAPTGDGAAAPRVWLSNQATVRSFAQIVWMKSKFIESSQRKAWS